ncbi:hypothetical protein SLA2020_228430 [Shorea laevis]
MGENDVIQYSNRKRIRQPPSAPSMWEEKPGIAKKDWNLGISSSVTPTIALPVRLTASVPFNWEDKPGKPLPCFSLPPLETAQPWILPQAPVCSKGYRDDSNSSDDGGNSNNEERMFDMDFEAFGYETDDSFSSATSFLANCLKASEMISTAVPVQKNSQEGNSSDHLETFSLPASEAESSISSHATGSSGLEGASFLEFLFPLLPPNFGFLERVRHSEQGSQAPRGLDEKSTTNAVIRRPLTLEELILMSQRRNYRRKAVQMRKQNLSMEMTKKRASGCCIFRTSEKNLIEGFEWKKFQPRQKFL